jgi:hypothetical protein
MADIFPWSGVRLCMSDSEGTDSSRIVVISLSSMKGSRGWRIEGLRTSPAMKLTGKLAGVDRKSLWP